MLAKAGTLIRPLVKNWNCLGEKLLSANMTVGELALRIRREKVFVESVVEGRICPSEETMGDILMALKIYPTTENIAEVFPNVKEDSTEPKDYMEGE